MPIDSTEMIIMMDKQKITTILI